MEAYSDNVEKPSIKALHLVVCDLKRLPDEAAEKERALLVSALAQYRPFDALLSEIQIDRVTFSNDEENDIFLRFRDFPFLKTRNSFLKELSVRIGHPYKLVIIDDGTIVSAAELSSLDKTSLIILGRQRYRDEHSFAKGFLHELGHSLGLRDECRVCQERVSAGPPNCAPSMAEAKAWWGDVAATDSRVGYFEGCCGNTSYIRSSPASLMNDSDRAEDFGPVSERFILQAFERHKKGL
ncbi:MAG: hypothetical protein HQL17_01505 [Candidatus Omnitrophica bacterium]|nr:hypothetical protein [Candidatus Omnitrophota bacterium]